MEQPGSPRGELTRRRFLFGASAMAAAPYLKGPLVRPAAAAKETSLRPVKGPHASKPAMGYVDGSATLGDLAVVPYGSATVSPADLRRTGDTSFVGDLALVRILGLTPGMPGGVHPSVQSVTLDALLPHPDPRVDEPVHYFAWTLRAAPFQASNPSSFVVAIGSKPRLGLTLDVIDHRGRHFASTAVLAPKADSSTIGLRRGIYLLGLREGTWAIRRSLPSASETTGAWADLVSLVVSVDHAAS